MKKITYAVFETILMVIIPGFLAIIEFYHPAHFKEHVFQTLHPIENQWLAIHYMQSFLFGLMAVAVYYITRKYHDNFLVWLIRASLFIFLITYTVLDAVGGLATGRLLTYVNTMGTKNIQVVVQGLFNDPIVGGVNSIYSLVGSLTWLIAIVLTVIVIASRLWTLFDWQSLPPLLLLLVCGYSLFVSHAFPYGPIAFSAFSVAGAWLLFLKRHSLASGHDFIF